MSEPEEAAGGDEDETREDQVEDVGEQADGDTAQEELAADLLEADASLDLQSSNPVRVTMANFLRAKLEGCIAADTTPPPWIVEMIMCGRPLGPSPKGFDELESIVADLQKTVNQLSRGQEKTVRFDPRTYGPDRSNKETPPQSALCRPLERPGFEHVSASQRGPDRKSEDRSQRSSLVSGTVG